MTQGFKIIGISVRTSNQDQRALKDLTQLWKTFMEEELFSKIPNIISNDILSIYTDYESDFNGEYTTIIGMKVSTLDEIPETMIGREFEADTFDIYKAKGTMPTAVSDMWMDIWKRDKELNRKYTYDFEVYDEQSNKGDSSEVDIYLAVNK